MKTLTKIVITLTCIIVLMLLGWVGYNLFRLLTIETTDSEPINKYKMNVEQSLNGKHICTDKEKQNQNCTLEIQHRVCSNTNREYMTGCIACYYNEDFWVEGQCDYCEATIDTCLPADKCEFQTDNEGRKVCLGK